ncbi:dimethylarginine dimethylaminohydrolase family protein [Rhizohabitans arisaemae]|uniref:dimethylarginine dimethylaminohydrolase family protein n=1 Tax=Rhizohabitans arisaemae TaxID=2720610 RepID=UPI0024B1469B|nr:arginine deiminase family protein [Rhizohabitans arisaemae]
MPDTAVDGPAVEVSIPSDVDRLREVVVGPVKAFTWESLAAEGDPSDDREATLALLKHNRVEIPDAAVATEEHAAFVALLRDHGVIVHTVDPVADVSIQLYPRDLAFAVDHVLVMARSRTAVRRREQRGLDRLLPRISGVVTLDEGRIEGGDVIVTGSEVLVGLGEETDLHAVEALRRALDTAGVDRPVVPLEFTHRGIVHLDTKFTMVGREIGLIHAESFTASSLTALQERFELIEVTADEARDLAVNTLALDPTTVVLRETSDRVAAELARRGITPVPVDFSEIARFPGAYRCATLPLRRG